MNKDNKAIDYGAALGAMTAMDRSKELAQMVIDNNYKLMELLMKMNIEDYNYYLPQVQKMIRETAAIFKKPETEDDIPEELFMMPGSAGMGLGDN